MKVHYFHAIIDCPAFVAYISNQLPWAPSSCFWLIPGQEG
jgi:hypothetical protein